MSCIHDLLAAIDGGRVLDVGCGHGRSTRMLAEQLRSAQSVVGIDPDKDSLDEARKLTDDRRITYRQLSVLDLPDAPSRFDTVSIAYALHHVPDPARVLCRLVDVLVPGGALLVNEAFSDGLTPGQENGRDMHHFKAAIDRLGGITHRETYTAAEIRTLVCSSGVKVAHECMEEPPDDDRPEERVREALEFLDEYLPFAEGHEEYPRLARIKERLAVRIRDHGLASPPHLFIVARKE